MTRSSVRLTKAEVAPSELQIITKIDAMITYCHLATGQFPKSEKPAFGRALRDHSWDLLEQVVVCNKKFHKKDTMQKADVCHEMLRQKVRKAHEWGLLPPRKYEHWAGLNDEIGKMIGGWIKAENARIHSEEKKKLQEKRFAQQKSSKG